MQEEPLLIKRNKNVATLVLNRPEKRNSLSLELVTVLLKTINDLADDDRVRAVVIRGSGDKAFCSGFDIRSLPTNLGDHVKDKLKTLNPVEALFNAIVNYPYPVTCHKSSITVQFT